MDITVYEIAVVKSGVNKRCANCASRMKVKNREDATKIMNVAETCTRDQRDLIGKGKIRIENETKVPKLRADSV